MKGAVILLISLMFIYVPTESVCENTSGQDDPIALKTIEDCIAISTKAGMMMQSGRIESCFNLLHDSRYFVRPSLTMSEKNLLLANMGAAIQDASREIGVPIENGFEYIGMKKTGESLLSIYYWSKHEYFPVAWKISFYKPHDEWKFLDFTFGAVIAQELFLQSLPANQK